MGNAAKYGFENKRKTYSKKSDIQDSQSKNLKGNSVIEQYDSQVFLNRFGIRDFSQLNAYEKQIVEGFINHNLYNVLWYSKRIKKEQAKLNWFYFFTLVLLVGGPIFVFLTGGVVTKGNLGTTSAVILTSILSVHQFVSRWLDQRKIMVSFSKASVELKNIYYHLENEFVYVRSEYDDIENQNVPLSSQLLKSLKDATILSRRIVDAETQRYYELRAQPSFDITNIWKKSAEGVTFAMNTFGKVATEKKVEPKQQKTTDEQLMSAEKLVASKKQELERLMLRLRKERAAEERLAVEIEALSKKKSLSEAEKTKYNGLLENFDKTDEKADELDQQCIFLETEIKILEAKLEAFEGAV